MLPCPSAVPVQQGEVGGDEVVQARLLPILYGQSKISITPFLTIPIPGDFLTAVSNIEYK
jgi:hypothetical protein